MRWNSADRAEKVSDSLCADSSENGATPTTMRIEEPEPLAYLVRRGDTFAGILARFGIVEQTAAEGFRLLKNLGLATLFPGDSLVIRLGDAGRLCELALCNRGRFWYRLVSDSSGAVRAERRPVETTIALCCVRGTLSRSLSEDMWELGETDALVAAVADIFAWDINFFTDPRVGDRFEVLFEKLYADGRPVGYGDILAARYHTVSGRTYNAFGLRDSSGRMRYYDSDGRSVQKQFLKAPLRYSRISSRYSYSRKHPILGVYRPHLGVDYAAPPGTPVYAAADGVVLCAGWNGNFGNQVCIRHGAAYETCYGHLQSIAAGIAKGVRVTQGRLIGTVGATGLASGPHLDYRMRVNGRYVNPLTVSLPSGDPVGANYREIFERTRSWCSLILDHRFAGVTGSHVVELRGTPAEPSVVSSITSATDSSGLTTTEHGG